MVVGAHGPQKVNRFLKTGREGHISHIKQRKNPEKNLFIFVAHRHPVPKSTFQMAKFKRPRVIRVLQAIGYDNFLIPMQNFMLNQPYSMYDFGWCNLEMDA